MTDYRAMGEKVREKLLRFGSKLKFRRASANPESTTGDDWKTEPENISEVEIASMVITPNIGTEIGIAPYTETSGIITRADLYIITATGEKEDLDTFDSVEYANKSYRIVHAETLAPSGYPILHYFRAKR